MPKGAMVFEPEVVTRKLTPLEQSLAKRFTDAIGSNIRMNPDYFRQHPEDVKTAKTLLTDATKVATAGKGKLVNIGYASPEYQHAVNELAQEIAQMASKAGGVNAAIRKMEQEAVNSERMASLGRKPGLIAIPKMILHMHEVRIKTASGEIAFDVTSPNRLNPRALDLMVSGDVRTISAQLAKMGIEGDRMALANALHSVVMPVDDITIAYKGTITGKVKRV